MLNNQLIKKSAIFLDRDGVINKEKNYVHKMEDFELENNVLEGLKSIKKDYLIFIVTNQSGIAKNLYTEKEFKDFDSAVCGFLVDNGINITKTYYCPHLAEENCSCRKPETGLLLKAKQEYNIDLNKSYFIGDKTSDILTGKRAGCRTVLVKTGYKGKDNAYSVKSDFIINDLSELNNII